MIVGNVTINYNATHITSDQNITLAPDVVENDPKYYIGSYEYSVRKNGTLSFSAPKTTFSLNPILFNQSSLVDISSLGLSVGDNVSISVTFYAVNRSTSAELSYNFTSQSVVYDPNIQATNYIKVSRRKRNVSQMPRASTTTDKIDVSYGSYASTNDSEHVITPVPDVLRDDGAILRIHKDKGPYWSKIVGGLDINYTYRLYYTHGYTLGGYKSSTAFRSVYKTIHNQGLNSTTSFLGNVLQQVNAYAAGAWGDRFAYVYKSRTDGSSGAFYSADGVSKFDMASETSVRDPAAFRSSYVHGPVGASVVNNYGLFGYIVSTNSGNMIEEHDLTTDVFLRLGISIANNGVNCATGKDSGFYYAGSNIHEFTFATKTASTIGISVASGSSTSSCIPSKRYYHYHAATSSALIKFDELTKTISGAAAKTYGFFEESWQTGESYAFTIGVYGNGGQNKEIHVMNLDTDTMSLKGNASGGVSGLSTSANVSAAGSLYSSLFPNYSLVHFTLV